MHTHTTMFAQVHMHAQNVCVYICVYVVYIYIYIHIYIYIYNMDRQNVCTYKCLRLCAHRLFLHVGQRETPRRTQPSAAPESPVGEGPSEQLLGFGLWGLGFRV